MDDGITLFSWQRSPSRRPVDIPWTSIHEIGLIKINQCDGMWIILWGMLASMAFPQEDSGNLGLYPPVEGIDLFMFRPDRNSASIVCPHLCPQPPHHILPEIVHRPGTLQANRARKAFFLDVRQPSLRHPLCNTRCDR